MRRIRAGWLCAVAALATPGLLLVLGRTCDLPCPAPAELDGVPAALVLSGDVDYRRIAQATALQREGRVQFILVTGAGIGGDDAGDLAREALARGADPARLLRESRSRSTRENLLFSAPIIRARGWRRVALVTSRLHMFRALHTARRVMPDVEWLPIPVPDAATPARLRDHRSAEWQKTVGYALRGWLR
jgi:uncharacterized SAM-binding protein YcdF (DUF218 family)